MYRRFGSIILDTSFRVLVPFTLVYGIYVLVHGEYSPGGGFQAGALLAVGVVLARLVQGRDAGFNIKGTTALIIAGLGTLLYGAIGFSTILFGGNFLEYERFPIQLHHSSELHALGMLGIEIGVTICVMATIIGILDALTGGEDLS